MHHIWNLFVWLSWLGMILLVEGEQFERMVVSKMRMSDLETSGSGYTYTQQQGLPASYVRYTNHGGKLFYDAPKPVQYVSPPVAHPLTLQQQPGLLFSKQANLAPYAYAPGLIQNLQQPAPSPPYFLANHRKFEPKDADLSSNEEDRSEKDDGSELEDIRSVDKWRPGVPHASHGVAYVNDAGETYDAAKYSAHGSKGETGYEKGNEFDEGESGAHFEDNHKGHYNDEGGQEKARSETAAHYAQHGEEEKGAKGTNYEQVKYHKKGHKTSGFHNVYHKDEYKKDTDFYDEKHDGGHFEKYDNNNERHRNVEGAFKKGLKHDSAYDRKGHANEGSFDKGRILKHRQGHNHEKGGDSYLRKASEFAKKADRNYKKEFGHGKRDFLD